MTPPALLFSRFLTACLLGAGLGFLYDFFSPLPRFLRHLGDGFFVLALFVCGIYLGFAVCDGDLRPAYSIGLFAGALLWHCSLGRLFRPLFFYVFMGLRRFFSFFYLFFEKIITFILLFFKKTFALKRK